MTIEAIVARYGLAALFLGAGLEGETAVIAGGLLAHRGLFPLAGAMIAAAAGSFVADQAWFLAGRRFRDHRWVRRAREKPAFARALGWLARHPTGFIFAFRFVYGFRTVSPVAIGTSDVPTRLFLIVNLASAVIWGVMFSAIGYLFGHGLERLLGRLRPDAGTLAWIALGVVTVVAAVAALRQWRGR